MAETREYKLKLYDIELARFSFAKTMAGFRAHGLEVDAEHAALLPLNMRMAPTDAELARFLASRRIPKGRAFLEEVLKPYGLSANDTKGIIDLSRGASVNDAYSVVPADDDIPYREYSLFDNDFDEVLQIIAYTGAIPQAALGQGRPSDLTPSGTFPKTWRKIGGDLVLFKAGSVVAAPNYGKEPYSEQLAWQVARAGGFDAVEYRLTEWQGKVCSTCKLFNDERTAFVPFELCLPSDLIQLADFELAFSYFQDIGAQSAEKFASMAVFDSLIANTDRHIGNFGVLRDNESGDVLDAAPLFDHNVSLFTRDFDESLSVAGMLARMESAPGILDATLGWQGEALAGSAQRARIELLVDFEFDDASFIDEYREAHPGATDAISSARLDALGAFIRDHARQLLAQADQPI